MSVLNGDVRRVVVEFCNVREMLAVRAVSSEWHVACEEWATYLCPQTTREGFLDSAGWIRAADDWADQSKRQALIALRAKGQTRNHTFFRVKRAVASRDERFCVTLVAGSGVFYPPGSQGLTRLSCTDGFIANPGGLGRVATRFDDNAAGTRLRHLALHGEGQTPTVRIGAVLSGLRALLLQRPGLQSLKYDAPRRIDEPLLETIAAGTLATLRLHSARWALSLPAAALPRFPTLTHVVVAGCRCAEGTSIGSLIAVCPNLHRFELHGECDVDEVLFTALGRCATLTSLNLHGWPTPMGVVDRQLSVLAHSRAASLTHLNLSGLRPLHVPTLLTILADRCAFAQLSVLELRQLPQLQPDSTPALVSIASSRAGVLIDIALDDTGLPGCDVSAVRAALAAA